MKKSVLLGPTAYKITWAGCPRGPLARQRAGLCSTVRWSAHAGGTIPHCTRDFPPAGRRNSSRPPHSVPFFLCWPNYLGPLEEIASSSFFFLSRRLLPSFFSVISLLHPLVPS